MSDQNNTPVDAEIYEPPKWLGEAGRLAHEARLFRETEAQADDFYPEFGQRCQEAAQVALDIIRLRRERERIGFVPLSLDEYIQGLAKVAGVRLGAVLRWLKIDNLSRPAPAAARACARFAHEIGVGVREALVHVRIGYAAHLSQGTAPLLLARYRGPGGRRGQVEECEVALGQIESEYGLNDLRELHEIESEIRAAYEDRGDAE